MQAELELFPKREVNRSRFSFEGNIRGNRVTWRDCDGIWRGRIRFAHPVAFYWKAMVTHAPDGKEWTVGRPWGLSPGQVLFLDVK